MNCGVAHTQNVYIDPTHIQNEPEKGKIIFAKSEIRQDTERVEMFCESK